MKTRLQKLTVTALFTALIFVCTLYVKLPVPVASGYVHLGDLFIYLCGVIVGPWAMLAGAVGAALADVVGGFAIYAPASAVIKVLIALPFVFFAKRQPKTVSLTTALMTLPAGLITVGGYYVADLVIDRSWALINIPGNIVQAVGSAILFIVVGLILDQMKVKHRLLHGLHRMK